MDLGPPSPRRALSPLGDAGEDLEPCTEPVEVSVVFPAVRLSSRRSPVAANACPEPAEGMPITSPRFTSKETSFSAQMVSLETVDDWPRTTDPRRRKGACTASVSDSRIVVVARLRAADAACPEPSRKVLFGEVCDSNSDIGHSNSSHSFAEGSFDNLRESRYNKAKLGGLVKSPVINPGQ